MFQLLCLSIKKSFILSIIEFLFFLTVEKGLKIKTERAIKAVSYKWFLLRTVFCIISYGYILSLFNKYPSKTGARIASVIAQDDNSLRHLDSITISSFPVRSS